MWKRFLKFAVVFIIAAILQHYAFIAANLERGYDAVGSEYFVFPFIMFIGLHLAGFFREDDLDEYEDDEYEDEDDLEVQYRDVV